MSDTSPKEDNKISNIEKRVADKVDRNLFSYDFFKAAETDKAKLDALKSKYPTLFKEYSKAKNAKRIDSSFPFVVNRFNRLVEKSFNSDSDSAKAHKIGQFVQIVVPALERSSKGDAATRRTLSNIINELNTGKYSFAGKEPYKYRPKEYTPVKFTWHDELLDPYLQSPWPVGGSGLAGSAHSALDVFNSTVSGAIDEIVPNVSYLYGHTPPKHLQPLAKAIIVAPQRVSGFLGSDVPELASKAMDHMPAVVENATNTATNVGANALKSTAKRLGWTGGGALLGAGIGLGLARGLTDEDVSGYDIPAALAGAGLGGLSAYYLSEDNNKTLEFLKNNKRVLEAVGSGAGLGLLYRALAKKPSTGGTVLASLVGSALPSVIRSIVNRRDKSHK